VAASVFDYMKASWLTVFQAAACKLLRLLCVDLFGHDDDQNCLPLGAPCLTKFECCIHPHVLHEDDLLSLCIIEALLHSDRVIFYMNLV
jgi:hypothetical protein